jgi:hypothetical protein
MRWGSDNGTGAAQLFRLLNQAGKDIHCVARASPGRKLLRRFFAAEKRSAPEYGSKN